jgi:hypothetical protein
MNMESFRIQQKLLKAVSVSTILFLILTSFFQLVDTFSDLPETVLKSGKWLSAAFKNSSVKIREVG